MNIASAPTETTGELSLFFRNLFACRKKEAKRHRPARDCEVESLEPRLVLAGNRLLDPITLADPAFWGISGYGPSARPSISGDGQIVVFQSDADNLVPNDSNGTTDIFAFDRSRGTLQLVSLNHDGNASGDGGSFKPKISVDGRYVLFESEAGNLSTEQIITGGGAPDLFVRDLQTGTTRLVSVSASGLTGGNQGSGDGSFSRDGSKIVFRSGASNLIPGTAVESSDIFIRDLQGNTTTLVSVNSAGTGGGTGFSFNPQFSGNGLSVVFQSSADNLVSGDANGIDDIFVRSLIDNTTRLVTVDPSNTFAANAHSTLSPEHAITDDGRFVVFSSGATNLVPENTAFQGNAFIRDLQTNTTRLLSVNRAGNSGSNGYSAVITPDGHFAAFISNDNNLGSNITDTNGRADVFVRDLVTNITRMASVNASGTNGGNNHSGTGQYDYDFSPGFPQLSADGRYVGFASQASDLVAGVADSNNGQTNEVNRRDVFVRDMQLGVTRPISLAGSGQTTGDLGSFTPVFSSNFRFAAFESVAGNLVPGDDNRQEDIFVRDLNTDVTQLASLRSSLLPSELLARHGGVFQDVSADGRFVVFTSSSEDLVAGSGIDPFDAHVFLRDRQTGTTEEVSVLPGGQSSKGAGPVKVSADGRFVFFNSSASLDPGVPNDNHSQIYVRDRQTATTRMVTVSATGAPGNTEWPADPISISEDGRYVTWVSSADNLVPGFVDGNGSNFAFGNHDVFFRDLQTGQTRLVSHLPGQMSASGNSQSYHPVISADASKIVFVSRATNLVAGVSDTNNAGDIFAYDVASQALTLLSAAPGNADTANGSSGDGDGSWPSISADGTYVVFASNAGNLAAGDSNSTFDVFRRNLQSNTTELVSRNAAGLAAGNGTSNEGTLSSNGRFVAFTSRATDLISGDAVNEFKVFVRDMQTGTTSLVSPDTSGTPAAGDSFSPIISGDGQLVAFVSDANDLIAGYVAGRAHRDLYVRDLSAGITELVSANHSGTAGSDSGNFMTPRWSGSTHELFFTYALTSRLGFGSDANDLLNGDRNRSPDVFAYHYRGGASIRGQLFQDFDADGIKGADDPALPFWTVYLDANGNGHLDAGEANVQSDAAGNYAFNGLAAGSETVRAVPQPRFAQISPQDAFNVTLPQLTSIVTGRDFAIAPLRPDLVVDSITIPPNATPGRELSISWIVRNPAAGAAPGDWQDAVYLSSDATIDAGDTLLVTVPHSGGLAGSNGTYNAGTTVAVPALAEGNYFVIVEADRRRQIVDEIDHRDNLRTSASPVALAVPELALGVPLSDQFGAGNEAHYYKLTVPNDTKLTVSLDGISNATNELYLRAGTLPTRWMYDARAAVSGNSDQDLLFSPLPAGTYYLMTFAAAIPPGVPNSYTLAVTQSGFVVKALDQTVGDSGGAISIGIKGTGFPLDLAANLDDGAGHTISASSILRASSTEVYATFDLRGAATAIYDLRLSGTFPHFILVEEPDRKYGQFVIDPVNASVPKAFSIVDPRGDDTELQVTAPAVVRAGREFSFFVTYTNHGTHDVTTPLVKVVTAEDALLRSEYDSEYRRVGSMPVVVLSREGPANVVRPGETVQLRMYSQALPTTGETITSVYPITDAAGPIDYGDFITFIGQNPQDPTWAPAVAALQNKYGSSWSSARDRIALEARQSFEAGLPLADLIQFFKDTAIEAHLNALAGNPVAPSTMALERPLLPPTPFAPPAPQAPGGSNTIPLPFDLLIDTLEEKEAYLADVALFFPSTGRYHLEKFIGPAGDNHTVLYPEEVYGFGSSVSEEAKNYKDAVYPFEAYDKALMGRLKANIEDEVRKTDGGSAHPADYPFKHQNSISMIFYKPNGASGEGFDLPGFNLQTAFGTMEAKGRFPEIDVEITDLHIETNECGERVAYYSAKGRYKTYDYYTWPNNQYSPWLGPLLPNPNNVAIDLLQAGWGTPFYTEIDVEGEEFKGSVNLDKKKGDPDTCCKKSSASAADGDDCDFPDTPPPPDAPPGGSAKSNRARSFDPNDIVGPAGFGDARLIRADTIAPYTIHFENSPNLATAPAQEVFISHQLDANLDWSTFELGDIGFGSTVVNVPPGLHAFERNVDYQNLDGTVARANIGAELNLQTGLVTWAFRSVDPLTGQLPEDVLAGFLPVNDASHRGEGFVNYIVKPKTALTTATAINQQASIVFDINEPILTNSFINTIDATPPVSRMSSLPAATQRTVFPIAWSGQDSPGSGLAAYDVFVSDNGGSFTLLLDDTPLTSTTFTGMVGHTYSFYTVASDHVGLTQAHPALADETVSILAADSLQSGKKTTFTDADGDRATISYKGPGSLSFGLVGGGDRGSIDFLQIDGGTSKSKLSVRVKKSGGGDGATEIGGVIVNGSLGSFSAKNSDLVLDGFMATGTVKSVALRDVLTTTSHPVIHLGGALTDKTNLTVRTLGDGFEISTPAVLSKINAAEIGAGAISAHAIGKVQVAAGRAGGSGSIRNSVVVADQIAALQVGGNVTGATILAGADLGSDHALGGTDTNRDTFGAGSIGKIQIKGNVASSVIAAGISTGDSILKNADDTIIGGELSLVGSLLVGGDAGVESYFAAGRFRSVPKINGVKIDPATDIRFLVS